MWWIAAVRVGMVVLGVILPTPREREIAEPPRVLPRDISLRDTAYVLEYFRRFGRKEFRLRQLVGKKVSQSLMDQFNVKSGPLDDKGILRTRLPKNGLLEQRKPGVYRLTEAAEQLAKEYEGI